MRIKKKLILENLKKFLSSGKLKLVEVFENSRKMEKFLSGKLASDWRSLVRLWDSHPDSLADHLFDHKAAKTT